MMSPKRRSSFIISKSTNGVLSQNYNKEGTVPVAAIMADTYMFLVEQILDTF